MRFLAKILIVTILIAPLAPAMAQTASTTATSSLQSGQTNQTNSNSNAALIGLGVGAGALGLGLLALISSTVSSVPTPVHTSFGGRIVAVAPCLSALGPSIWFTIVPAGIFPITYIWTPATITHLAGPPRNPGQQVLGVADIPFLCKVGVVPLYGQRVQIIGTSAI